MDTIKYIEARQESALLNYLGIDNSESEAALRYLGFQKYLAQLRYGILFNKFPCSLSIDGFDKNDLDEELEFELDLLTDVAAGVILSDDDPLYNEKKQALRTQILHFEAKGYSQKERFWQLSAKFLRSRISCYEDPYTYLLLRECEEEIREAAQKLGHKIVIQPIIINLISSGFNATISPVPGKSDYLLGFRYGIFYFYEALIKHYVQLLIWKWQSPTGDGRYPYQIDQKFAEKIIQENEPLLNSFNSLLMQTLVADIQNMEHSLKAEKYMVNLDNGLRTAVWHFLMGHEYGHIINGDLGSKTDWLKEYKADARGFELMNHLAVEQERMDFQHSILAAAMVFAGMDLIYRAISVVLNKPFPPADATHPSPLERWKNLTRVIYHNSEDKSLSLEAFNQASRLADVLEVLFAYSQPMLEGIRLSPEFVERVSHNWQDNY